MRFLIKRAAHWLLLFLLTDAAALFAVWILRPEAFWYLTLFLFLFTVISLAAGIYAEYRSSRKDAALLSRFFETPDEQNCAELLAHFNGSKTAAALCHQVLSLQALANEKTVGLAEYRSYIEGWVHEAKTPLALSTMLLENHKDEIPPYLYTRLSYVQHQLSQDVERILYYARLQADHPDIRFQRFSLDECVREIFSEYEPFLKEKHISAALSLNPAEVDSDPKIVSFMLSQLLSNAVKYADPKDGKISAGIREADGSVSLLLCNNGAGAALEDEPFLFDKGFTGSRPNQQNATGMGLYLVRKYGQKLCVTVRLSREIPYESGFGIEMIFRQ